METNKKLHAIHKASMRILEEVGIVFYSDEIIKILKSHGIRTEGQKAYFTEEQIMSWVKKAPSEFTLYARNPDHNMTIGGDVVNYVSATCGYRYIVEPSGERLAVHDDFVDFLKLNQVNPWFKINGGVMTVPSDLSNVDIFPTMLFSSMYYSDKCIFGGMGGATESLHTMNMLKIAIGEKELLEKSQALTLISVDSPLQFSDAMCEMLISYVEHNQAIIVAPAVMAGANGPVTLAGTIALTNAESLAGVAVAQMIRQGAPVIYGTCSCLADMKTGNFSFGTPESALAIKYGAQMAKFYNLPCRGGGSLTDTPIQNAQSGYEGMMCLLVAAQNKTNFILHSAGELGAARSMSIEKYIMDLDIIGYVDYVLNDIDISEDSLAVDLIKEVGIGGEFFSHDHTFENFRSATFISDIAIRGGVVTEDADVVFKKRIADKKEQMFAEYKRPDFDKTIEKQLANYLDKIGYDVRY